MILNTLGKTNKKVSKICFGSLTMGPLQKNFSSEEGAELLKYAFDQGINCVDTAELYETYSHISKALDYIPRQKYTIVSKSYAYSKETAQASLFKALEEIKTDYIDVFMLHEQESVHTLRGHYEAIEYFLKAKEEGLIGAIGLSTHYIEGVRAALKYPEIEVIHPIINLAGLGIQDGTAQDMVEVLSTFHAQGGGIIAMKPFGGGHLIQSREACFEYILKLKPIDSIAIGMQSLDEIDYNVKRVRGEPINHELTARLKGSTKKLNVADWCTKCGACIKKCSHNALHIIDDQVVVNQDKCVLCGYCASVCPEFCIKVY